MELKRYAALLLHWGWLVAVTTGVTLLMALVISFFTPPSYQSTATLLINQPGGNNTTQDYNSLVVSGMLGKTYERMLVASPLLDKVINTLKLDTNAQSLAKRIKVNAIRDTQLMDLLVEDSSREGAVTISNELIKEFQLQVQGLQSSWYQSIEQTLTAELNKSQADQGQTQEKINALLGSTAIGDITERNRLEMLLADNRNSYAILLKSLQDVRLAQSQSTSSLVNISAARLEDTVQTSPRFTLNLVLGGITGFLLSIGYILLQDYLDDKVRSAEAVRQMIDVPLLGTVGAIKGVRKANVMPTLRQIESSLAESFHLIQANLAFARIEDSPGTSQAILVASGSSGEGKTLTLLNLAIAIRQMGKSVIVVDTNLRQPSLHYFFSQSNTRGLTTALAESMETVNIMDHLIPTGIDNLLAMSSGPLPPNVTGLLSSTRLVNLISELKLMADVILLDSPAALTFTDASLLSKLCDSTLLVVRVGYTRADIIKRTRDQFGQSKATLLGFILNMVPVPTSNSNSGRRYQAFNSPYPAQANPIN